MVNSSVESLANRILTLKAASPDNLLLVLVGGCSRAGKTALVSKLTENIAFSGIESTVMNLDSWLVSVDKRKYASSVLERYEVASIILSAKKIRQGEIVYPPVYDVVSRKRIAELAQNPIFINKGILFIDGVVALAIDELVENAALRIFVEIPDGLRRQRLVDLYSKVKKLGKKEYESIIEAREKEEVPFIKRTSANADIIFSGLSSK